MHLNGGEQAVGPGSVIYIPRCHRHGITNTGMGRLCLYGPSRQTPGPRWRTTTDSR